MAGQPPDPAYPPSGPDQTMTQGISPWQQGPSYTPPGGAPAGPQQGYPPPPYGAQEQAAYLPPPQQQDQVFTGSEPGYPGQAGQGYQGYQAGFGAQQGQGGGAPQPPPQWQGIATQAPAAIQAPAAKQQKKAGEKGFVGSLFDFSFSSFVTPKIVKALYALFTLWTVFLGLVILVIGFRSGGVGGGLFTLILVEPVFLLVMLGIYRVFLEAFMVIFRIYEEMTKIRENTDKQD